MNRPHHDRGVDRARRGRSQAGILRRIHRARRRPAAASSRDQFAMSFDQARLCTSQGISVSPRSRCRDASSGSSARARGNEPARWPEASAIRRAADRRYAAGRKSPDRHVLELRPAFRVRLPSDAAPHRQLGEMCGGLDVAMPTAMPCAPSPAGWGMPPAAHRLLRCPS